MRPSLFNLDIQVCIPQLNEKTEELKQIQLSVDTQEQLESALVGEDDSQTDKPHTSPLCSMYFDGSCTRSNAGAGVWIRNTENNHTESLSCRLNFQCSNNIAEYESLLLGLHLLKKLGAKRIKVHGDS